MDNILPFPKIFYDDAKKQLESIPHYGVQSSILDKEKSVMRSNYVEYLCKHLFQLKKTVRGRGYGSSKQFKETDSGDWKDLDSLTGLEICQSWSVLLNAGHLFGTSATERALLFVLDKELESRKEFILSSAKIDFVRMGLQI